MDNVFKKSLIENGLAYTIDITTQPTILNNILWYGIAETDSTYYVGILFVVGYRNHIFRLVNNYPKQRDLKPDEYEDIKNLAWFSNDYYNVYKLGDNELSI